MQKRRPGAASGSRRPLPSIDPSSNNLRDGVLPSLGTAKKILDILEGKRVLTPPAVLQPVKEPAVEALEVHPLAQDQAKYLTTNLRRFKQKRKGQGKDGSGDGSGNGADTCTVSAFAFVSSLAAPRSQWSPTRGHV